MKQIFYFFIILMIFGLTLSCGSRDVSVTITNDQMIPAPAQPETSAIENPTEGTRPLIVIKPSDELQIYVRADGAPGMYLGEDQAVHGFYVDLERLLMKEMGQKYQFVAYDNVGPAVQKIKSGEAHSALAVPDLPDYRTFLNLSDPFEILNFYVFVQRGNQKIGGADKAATIKSLAGKRVGVQTRGHIYQTLREYKDIELVEYATTTEAMKDLAAGKLDAVPEVRENGVYYAQKNNWEVTTVGMPLASYNDTTGFSKAVDPAIIKRYNAALRTVRNDGRFQRLYESYFGK